MHRGCIVFLTLVVHNIPEAVMEGGRKSCSADLWVKAVSGCFKPSPLADLVPNSACHDPHTVDLHVRLKPDDRPPIVDYDQCIIANARVR